MTIQAQLARTTACNMAKLYNASGYDVVVDDVCIPEFFADQYTELFDRATTNSSPVYKVLLMPQPATVIERARQRGGPNVEIFIEHGIPWIYSYLGSMDKAGWIVIDSSNLTIEETAEAALQRINPKA